MSSDQGKPRKGDREDPRAIHQRIAADLRDEIFTGELPRDRDSKKLPSTAELVERFGASNATIQKAVGLLKAEDLVTGRPGASITVTARPRQTMVPAAYSAPAEPGETYRWITEAEGQGYRATSELREVGVVAAPREVAAAFGIPEASPVVCRSQVLHLDGQPAELVHSYYPLAIAEGTPLLETRKIKGGTPTLLAGLGYVPAPKGTVDVVTACIPTQEQFAVLQLPGELVPVLRTFRVVRTAEGVVIEVTVMVKAGHLYALQYTF
ncbi:GntR family transcriptional regulator [Streptomyces sp. NRRL S-350]|uniref:GntR family transcriptional regulator n=1 Tax=Streptomyces sp. NRRL S-350 TaxID=1463902 RepID=UPI0004BE4DB2|nr:GntR family transcriptional regulator [Streptomyces sp. NRRL S-350]